MLTITIVNRYCLRQVLAHRLGLVPIFADPNDFQYKSADKDYDDKNSILFKLRSGVTGDTVVSILRCCGAVSSVRAILMLLTMRLLPQSTSTVM